jgi:hypothetical protein
LPGLPGELEFLSTDPIRLDRGEIERFRSQVPEPFAERVLSEWPLPIESVAERTDS